VAIDPVLIKFATAGVAEVDRAFASIVKRMEATEVAGKQAAVEGSRARVRSAEQEAAAKDKLLAKEAKELERWERQKTAEVQREARVREREASRAANDVAREEKRLAEKSAQEIERLEQYKLRVRIESAKAAGRAAEQAAAVEISAAEKVRRATGAVMYRGLSRTAGSIGRLTSMAGSALSIGGGFALADIAGQQLSAERTAALIVNAGTTNGVAPGTVGQALKAAGEASNMTGMSRGDILQGALKYAQSARGGDFGGALANMGFFAKMAKATGTDIGDIAEAAGVLQSQNASLGANPKAMQQMLLNALAQSHAGSMSMVDAAKQIGTMGSTRSSFASDEARTQNTLIGLGQIARVGGDVGEAGTFVKDLSLEVSQANQKYREMTGGKRIGGKMVGGKELVHLDEHGRIESPEAMIAQVFRATHGNIDTINQLFGRRGGVLFRELEKSYLTGEKTGGVEGGVSSVLSNVKSVAGATMTPEELDKQVATMLATPAEKLHTAWEKLVTTTGDKLEPVLSKLADKMPEVIDKLGGIIDAGGKLAEFLLDNPYAGVAAVVSAKVGQDIAQAAIGEGVKKVLSTSIAQSVASGGLKLAVAGGAVAIAAEILNVQVQKLEESQHAQEAGAAAFAKQQESIASDLASKTKSGKVTTADISRANKQLRVLRQEIDAENAATPGAMDMTMQYLGGLAKGDVTGEGVSSAMQKHQDSIVNNTKKFLELESAIDKAIGALAKMRQSDPARHSPIDQRTGGGA
jgi:hypothetical protein